MNRRVAFCIAAMTAAQIAVYIARPTTSYRLLGLGAGAREVGFVTAAFALIPLFLAIPLGRSADRRRAPLVTVGCAVQVVACLLLAWAQTPLALGGASAVLGLGHLGVALGVQEVIARESDDRHHDRDFGLLTAGVALGQMIGPLIGGFVLDHGGSLLASTKDAMLIAAVVVVPATALAAVGERGRGKSAPVAASRRGSVRTILGTRGVAVAIFASIAVLSAADIFTAYMPVIGEQRGIAPGVVGVLLALRAAASMVSRIGITRLVALVGRERLIILSAASAAVALGAIAFVHGTTPLAVLCVLAGLGLGFSQPLSMTLIVQLVPEYARGTALAVRLAGNRLGQVAAPAAAGVVAGSAGARAVFWVLSALLGCSALAIRRVPQVGGRAPGDAEAAVET
ncbi:MAG: integral rane transport protein [Actinomycetia bacterium]|nr:integral rane transport protein [Actinomycetes bacterium]